MCFLKCPHGNAYGVFCQECEDWYTQSTVAGRERAEHRKLYAKTKTTRDAMRESEDGEG